MALGTRQARYGPFKTRKEGLSVKRLTFTDGLVILESDSRKPKYAPRVVHLRERRTIEKIARGRVVWYATEVA